MAIDVNAASREDLIALTGIGEHLADALIGARPFSAIDDLLSIVGIGQRNLDRLKEQGLAVVGRQITEGTMADQVGEMPVGAMIIAVAGEMDVMPGEEMAAAVAGEMDVMPGEEMAAAVAGEMDVMPGEEMTTAVAGDVQAVELTGTWRLMLSLTSLKSSRRS